MTSVLFNMPKFFEARFKKDVETIDIINEETNSMHKVVLQ